MASGVKADQIGDDWSDNEEKTHEIVVEGTDFTELDEDMRSEQVARKTGPAWGLLETSEPVVKEVAKGGKFRAPKLSDKKAPVVNTMNFPGLADVQSEKKSESRPDGRSEGPADDSQSNNPYSKLRMAEEEEAKPEKKQQPRKSGKKKGKDKWNKVETKVTIATSVEEINSKDIFAKEPEKVQERYERPQESRNFQIKPSGAGFRNFDNRQESGPFGSSGFRSEASRQETGPFARDNRDARDARDTRDNRDDQGKTSLFGGRRNEPVADKVEDSGKPIVWRRSDNVTEAKSNPAPAQEGKVESSGPKRFFNANKNVNKESIDPLQPKAKVQEDSKKDVWGDQVKPVRKNPWRTDN